MTKNIVGGVEVSDDLPVTEYDGKFSGTFELDPETGKLMGYDDVVYFVVTARVDTYSYKPTKWGDLKRVNTLKVDNVRKINVADLNKLHHVAQPEIMQPALDEIEDAYEGDVYEMGDPAVSTAPVSDEPAFDEEEIFVPAPRKPERPAPSRDRWVTQDMPNTGRNYKDPILRSFIDGPGV